MLQNENIFYAFFKSKKIEYGNCWDYTLKCMETNSFYSVMQWTNFKKSLYLQMNNTGLQEINRHLKAATLQQ